MSPAKGPMGLPLQSLATLFVAVALSEGCEQSPVRPIGTVHGKVSTAGLPVSQGSILFENTFAGVSTLASLEPDGSYRVRTHAEAGLPVGKYHVAVTPQRISTGTMPLAGSEPKIPPKIVTSIPPKYHLIKTSPLFAEVKEGENPPFNFDLAP